jgi:hypothetical protein
MSTIRLSSYERIRRYDTPDNVAPHADSLVYRREVENWIGSVSRQIERWLDRELLKGTYTEYFDLEPGQVEYPIRAIPVTTLTDVYSDPDGLWDGSSETQEQDPHIGVGGRSVVLSYHPGFMGMNALRVRYVGGISSSGTDSQFTVTGATTFTVGRFVANGSYSALGIVKAASGTTLTVENLYGTFAVGDTLTEYTGADGNAAATTPTGATAISGTISTIVEQSMAEGDYGDIVRAAELQVLYYLRHKLNLESVGSTREGVNLRRRSELNRRPLSFTEEAYALLVPYRRAGVA